MKTYGPCVVSFGEQGLSWWASQVEKSVCSVTVGYSVCQLGQLGW